MGVPYLRPTSQKGGAGVGRGHDPLTFNRYNLTPMPFPSITLRRRYDLLTPDHPSQASGRGKPRVYPLPLMAIGDYFDIAEGSAPNVRNAIWRFTSHRDHASKRFAVRRHPAIDQDMRRCVRLA